ncbi:TPA_exp: putative Ferric-chelate reductase (Fre2) [Trichophyton benhamiae CBS 112371]|nr:TPA_exp: putative Ferric-chelate reductase (Fre2) [Trichophyton benhamiae CBS 112371]
MSDFAANLTDETIAKMKVIENGEISPEKKVNTPVLISKKFFDLSLKTVVVNNTEVKHRHHYGFAMYGIWGTVLVLGMINNFCKWAFFRQSRTKRSDLEGSYDLKLKNPHRVFRPFLYLSDWIQTHLTIPSTFGSYHLRTLYGCDMPTRIEAIVIFSYWLIIAILCCVNYDLFAGNLNIPKTNAQLCRYIAGRTGVLSFANLPLAWMFAGRNNIFLWATGWSFRMFNIFHRQAALAATLLAIAHSIAFTIFFFLIGSGIYIKRFTEKWFCMGVVGTVVMSFLVIFSCLWLRRKTYELFLLIHIALSTVTIISMFYHVSVYGGEYDPYLWPLVAIWGFERTLRIIRIIYCNLRVRFAGGGLQHTSSVAYYDEVSDIIRLEVTPAATGISQKPGRYYFLYQPFRWTGYESHPFTLGAWAETSKVAIEKLSETGSSSPVENSKSDEMQQVANVSKDQNPEGSPSNETTYVFWIRPYNGWTRQLRDQCLKSSGTAISTTLLLEGPYGDSAPLWAYESVLFIVGGTGIAAAVPYIQDHIRRTSATGTGTCTKDMTLVWSARQASYVHNVASRELQPALERGDFSASFYLTNGDKSAASAVPSLACTNTTSSLDTNVLDELTKDSRLKSLTAIPKYEVKYGRPDTKSIILERAKSANAANSRLAVLVCGPDSLADEAREAIHKAMLQGYRQIRYIEDAYSW